MSARALRSAVGGVPGMRSGGGFTDHLINVLAVCAALLSLVGFGYIVHHALKARQDMDDASDLTAAAIRGDIESQRRLAACYVEGCPPLPRSDIIACAWRRIALQTAGTAAEDAERARAICDTLSAQDAGIAENARRTLEHRIESRRALARTQR